MPPLAVDVGTTLDVYRLDAKLVKSRIGAVYNALHTKLVGFRTARCFETLVLELPDGEEA